VILLYKEESSKKVKREAYWGKIVFTLIPMIFMLFMTGWAMVKNISDFQAKHNYLLFSIGLVVFLLEIWMIIEAVLALSKYINNLKKLKQ